MPVYTKIQTHALALLRKLRSARHNQLHWLICLEFPQAKGYVATEMRRLVYLSRAMNDGAHYCWPGCEIDKDLIIAIDIMRKASGGAEPSFCLQAPPGKLAFSVIRGNTRLACNVFFPKPGKEADTSAAIDALEPSRTAAVFIRNREQMSLFTINRPHVFVCVGADGQYEYISGADNRTERD